MIRRDVVEFPDRIEDCFDYVNDTTDTAMYLHRIGRVDLAQRLELASAESWKAWKKMREEANWIPTTNK